MLLQTLLMNIKEVASRDIVKMVMTQNNLLLCLVSDTLDLKMIE